MWDGMFLHPLGKAQLGFDWKQLWAKAVASVCLKEELEKKASFSSPGAVAQHVFSLCSQAVAELGLTVAGCGSTNARCAAGPAVAAWHGCESAANLGFRQSCSPLELWH